MSDFITTMAARATGEISRVEPLISSMFLPLPAMPGDYTEDMFAEPELPESWEDDPDLSFLPLLNYDPWSVEIPNWYENEDFEVEETEGENTPESLQTERTNKVESPQNLSEKIVSKNTSDSNLDTEIKIIESEVILREENREWQSQEEASSYSATPQDNSLDLVSPSVEVNGQLNPLVSKNESESPQVSDDNRLNISKELTNSDNRENRKSSTDETSPTITPQINRLEAISPSLQANVDSNTSISNIQSESTTASDNNQLITSVKVTNSENSENNSSAKPKVDQLNSADSNANVSNISGDNLLNITKSSTDLEHQETNTPSSNEILPKITPAINRLELASPSLQAQAGENSSISNTESDSTPVSDNSQVNKQNNLKQNRQISNDNQVKVNRQLNSLENEDNYTSSQEEKLSNITPQVSRLETTSISAQAGLDSHSSTSNTKLNLNEVSDDNSLQISEKFTDLDNGEVRKYSQDDTSATITPQVSRLETASSSLQANVDLNSSTLSTESESTKTRNNKQATTNNRVTSLENSEFNSSAITPQLNRLEKESQSVKANVKSHSPVINTNHDLIQSSDNHQEKINQTSTNIGNREADTSFQEDKKALTVTPQVNQLEEKSRLVQANVESNPLILNTESELAQKSDNHQGITSTKGTELDNRKIPVSSTNKNSSTITPQINRLEKASESVKANVESHPSIANQDYDVIQKSDESQAKVNQKADEHDQDNQISTEAKVKPILSTSNANNLPRSKQQLAENLDTGKQNNSSINETPSTVVPQVSRSAENLLSTHTNEKVSKANIESNQNEQVNKIGKQQKANPSSASPSESNSVSDNKANNPSLISPLRQLSKLINRSNNKQKQKQSDLTRKKIAEKTVTLNLQNNSAFLATSQESSNLQEQRLSHINQIRPGKESVKPELKSDASYSLPNTILSDNAKSKNSAEQSNSQIIQRSPLNSSQIPQSSQTNQLNYREENRTTLPQQKITPKQTVEARIKQPANILSDPTFTKKLDSERSLHDTEKREPPISRVSQSSNSPQKNSVLSNPDNASLNLNSVKNAPNTKYIPNSVSKNESKLNRNYSRIKPNINESIPVITNQEISTNLSPPKNPKISPVNNQTESRQNQSESRSSPTIQITIGRIEVRGNQAPPSPKSTTRKSTKKTPSLSLQDYLKQRDGK